MYNAIHIDPVVLTVPLAHTVYKDTKKICLRSMCLSMFMSRSAQLRPIHQLSFRVLLESCK